ncbi:MAG: XisI protein [Cytophagales bacterium]|nr:MAG: XisI protein [Cytophagales bacterium]
MEKLTLYQNAVIEFIRRYVAETGANRPDEEIKRRILIDRENNSFQLLSAGWRGSRYIFGPIFHFDLIEGKIWIQCNNTEREIVDELMANGVDQQDIVLGFISPPARQFTGFGIA